MNITALLSSYRDKSGEQHSNINMFIAKSIYFVIQAILLKSAESFVLSLSCRHNRVCNFYNDLLEKLFHMWNPTVLQLVAAQRNATQHIDGDRLHNLILIDSYEAFLDLDIIHYTVDYDINEFYYIFLQTSDDLIPQEMQKIFEYCWSNFIINCSVQIQTALGELLVYTYFPFTAQHCGKVLPVLINQYKNDSFLQHEFFPNKLKNMHSCPLKAALWNVAPFVFLQTQNNKTRVERGFEGALLMELAARLNFSIEVLVPPNDERHGLFIGNRTTGAIRMLMERTADLSLGSFRATEGRHRVLTPTITYYITKQVSTICDAKYTFSSKDILMFPFSNGAWFCILITFAIAALQCAFINCIYKEYPSLFPQYSPQNSYLNIILIFVGMPAISLPVRFNMRLYMLNWFIFTLIIRTVYQALLFHLIRTNITKNAPQTSADLLGNNYTAVVSDITRDSLAGIALPKNVNPKILVINTTSDTFVFSYIEKYDEKNLYAIGPLDILLYYGKKNKKAGVFKIMERPVNSFQIVMYLAKHSFLIDQFNEEIMWMLSVGLIQVWSGWELDYQYFVGKHLHKNVVFSFKDLEMFFITLAIGLGIACVIFILEILSEKLLFLKRIFGNV